MISPNELQDLVTTLHKVRENEMQGSLLKEWLTPLMQHVPAQMPLQQPSVTNGQASEDASLKKTIRTKVNKIRNTGNRGSNAFDSSSVETVDEASSKDLKREVITEVLVMPLPTSARRDFPGGLTEDMVLSMEQTKRTATRVRLNLENLEEKSSTGSGKRTKFFGDQESIAGASDNLEAVSEAASMASSLDIEENAENDNLSDMVSANVSGPGTPSVSGRDTPSSHGAAPVPPHPSQIAEQLQLLQGNPPQAQHVQLPPPSNAIPTRRRPPPRQEAQKQMDMEDRFGRFGIGKSTGAGSSITEEETKSMVSDTWSTEVLGSDSEAYNATQEHQQHLESHLNALQQQIHGHLSQHNVQQLIDLSETQSDAWSTAAMTSYSDLDRLQEVENQEDDMISGSDRGQNGDEAVPEFVGAQAPADRQSTPTNLIKLDSGEDNLIDIISGGNPPLVEVAAPQSEDIPSGAFAHSLSNGSVVSFAGSFNGDGGSQSLGRLSFAMKEQSLSGENLLDGDIVMVS